MEKRYNVDDDFPKSKRFRDEDRPFRPKRKFDDDKPRHPGRKSDDEDRPFRPKRRFDDEDKPFRPKRRYDDDDRPYRPKRRFEDEDKPYRPKRRFEDEDKPFRPKRRYDDDDKPFRPKRRFDDEDKPYRPKRRFDDDDKSSRLKREEERGKRPRREKHFEEEQKPRRRNITAESEILTEIVNRRKLEGRPSPKRQRITSLEYEDQHGPVRLNKYIANAGICSRREADVLIASGAVTVNGVVVTEMGHKVLPTDEVRYGDRILQRERPVYVLLNKPKDYITTTDDERDRPNVMELVRNACSERIYPVGRLDRDTTGLLLFTNDGDLTKKLTHPSSQIEKTYSVELNRNFAAIDMAALRNGLQLNDGLIIPDEAEYVGDGKTNVGITIHSGKNRIIRRIFEYLGYEVVKLDRVVFAGLTKKDLPRGRWRFLTNQEVAFLKMLSVHPTEGKPKMPVTLDKDEQTPQTAVDATEDEQTPQTTVDATEDEQTPQTTVDATEDEQTPQTTVDVADDEQTPQTTVDATEDEQTPQMTVDAAEDEQTPPAEVAEREGKDG